jgi:threonine synthase
MAPFSLVCTECGARYTEHEVRYLCPACARGQAAGEPLRGVLRVELDRLPSRWPSCRMSDSQALVAYLPVASTALLPPLAVGCTPLLPAARLRQSLAMPHLWLKDDSRNPSGSTKDRASHLVVAKAREYGLATVACASTGNAATALACVAAAAAVRAVVFVPAAAPPAKLVQIAAYGAVVVPVDGPYDAAFDLCAAACERFGWYNRNTAYNPFTIEGKKTVALEIAAELAPERADVVVVPTGDGVVVAGLAKGFADLVTAGVLAVMPRLVVVQPDGSAAIARALRERRDVVSPLRAARSVADSLVVGVPRNAAMALREVRASEGGGVIVSDAEIVEAIARLARLTGVFAEPAGAAVLPGLERALAERLVDRDERVVLLVTGAGLKDVAAAGRAVTIPPPVAPRLEAVESFLGAEGVGRRGASGSVAHAAEAY